VRQLDTMHPRLRTEEPAAASTSTIAAPVEHLDLATVIKVSQAVSGEIVLEKLLELLMRTAIEQAGAERGLLILQHEAELRIKAEAASGVETILVQLRDQPVTANLLPESALHYVLRTHESVLLEDAVAQPSAWQTDPYICDRRARSVLCLPLITQAKLIGALYLENNLIPNAFAPARMAALKLLASQAAISLENSRLYGDLQERESKIRRLVDANIIGIFIWDLDGRILEANDIFLRMVGYDRDDLLSGRMRWTDLTPPEWRDQGANIVEEVKTTGIARPYEKEYFRKDGSRVPVLIGSAIFAQSGNQGVAFLLDLTERKQAEAEALESERRFHQVQMELAHANRVGTMGQLTASIAHEVNHPIAATIANAQAGLLWLNRQPPQLDEVGQVLTRIVKDGRRASNVVGRLRDLFKKTAPRMERLDINGAIAEVIELTRGEVVKNGISTQIRLADGLPVVQADRTQLQQVILNLIVNAVQALTDRGDSGRELSISTSTNGPDEVLVSVCDSGPGITSEDLGRLFDPFYTTKPGGMGVGLSICRSIMEGHGGRIWATANDPQGAAFHFTLPAARQELAAAQNADHA
jgi:PAS domain S-box-containing protein